MKNSPEEQLDNVKKDFDELLSDIMALPPEVLTALIQTKIDMLQALIDLANLEQSEGHSVEFIVAVLHEQLVRTSDLIDEELNKHDN